MGTKKVIRLAELRQKLNASFDKEEIRSLCFDLGIDYDNLPETKDEAIRELIRHQIRHNQMEALIDHCRRLRPQINWPKVPGNEIAFLLGRARTTTKKLSTKKAKERQRLLILLEKVKKFWIKGVLEKSTIDGRLIKLSYQEYPEAIDHPWPEELATAVSESNVTTSNQNILDTFQESDRALLILGEPGAGKTTTLLELTRELITLAEEDPAQPIPVVLKLSSWAESQGSLLDWAVEELSTKYHIPRKIGRPWLEKDKLLLLLDGMASVPDKQREACVQAINQFRSIHGFSGLAVSSRINEYESINTKLQLSGAIRLRNLTPAQIDAYLAEAGSKLLGLRQAIRRDAALQQMAQTPLMLHVMSATYSDLPSEDADDANLLFCLPAPAEPSTVTMISQRQQILNGYVQRMFQRCGDTVYSYDQTQRSLSWLAQRMSQHHQSIFQLDQIQPSWLPSRHWRWSYLLLTRSFLGLFVGIMMWLVVVLGLEVNTSFSDTGLYQKVADSMHQSFLVGALITWIGLNTTIGLFISMMEIYLYEISSNQVWANEYVRERRKWHVAGLGIATFLCTSLVFLLQDSLLFAILAGLFNGFHWIIASSMNIFRAAYHHDIQLVEALKWSSQDALRLLPMGIFAGLALGIAISPFADSSVSWATGGAVTFFVVIYSGLRPLCLEENDRPNEGIKISIRNSFKATLLFALGFGLVTAFAIHNARAMFIGGLLAGLGAVGSYGSGDVLKHLLVRLLLWWQNRMPLRYEKFLNHAAGLTFLHKVGGGYIFIHRLLQAYFSDLDLAQSNRADPDFRTALSSSQVL